MPESGVGHKVDFVGIGSREHDAFDDFIIMDDISSDDVGLN